MFGHNTIPDSDWDALRQSADWHGDSTIGEHISSAGLGPDSHEMPASSGENN